MKFIETHARAFLRLIILSIDTVTSDYVIYEWSLKDVLDYEYLFWRANCLPKSTSQLTIEP